MGLNRDFLKGLGLEQEAINGIMAEYGKELSSHTEVLNKLKEEKLALNEKALKAQGVDELNAKVKAFEEEQSKWATEKEALENASKATIKDLKKQFAIKSAIAKSAPIDDVAYNAHLDFGKLEYDEATDTLKGFEEQDKAIRENYGFLFTQGATGAEQSGFEGSAGDMTLMDAIADYYKK